MRSLQYFQNLPITTKFILWFLFIALVPLAIGTYISYRHSRQVLVEEVTNSLLAIADNKARQLETYLNEQEKNVTTLSHMSATIEAVERFETAFERGGYISAEYNAADEEFRPFLTYYQRSFGYEELLLIRPNGEIIFAGQGGRERKSLYEIALYRDSQLAKVFIKTKTSLKTEISDFEYSAQTKKAAVFIAAPVFKGAGLIGVVIMQLSNQGICELVKDYTGLGRTGETIVAAKMENEAVFITPLRFDPQAAFKRRIAIGAAQGLAIQSALQKKKGVGTFVDYRGEKVLAVWRYLPSFRLGMVVKMDTVEVFASAQRLRNTLLLISPALLTLVAIMAVLIARSISRPIKALTDISATITRGDLCARARIGAKDEIGILACSFNQMTNSLVEAKANVEEQKRLLEKANQELDSFVYTVSHDLRAPLRAISSFASFLEEDYKNKLDKEGKDYLQEIRAGAQRMNQLIEDLLTLSRISRIQNPYEEVDINALVDSVRERIKFDIQEKKVALRVQENLPSIKCDRIKMAEVFLNLINNAIKFSAKNNKADPRVQIGYLDTGADHKFYVQDNGIGIAPQYREQIFSIFKRLHTAKEYEGTGAGLSIVKRVINDHGGKVWVESQPGKGATFYFTIPKDLEKEQKKTG